jgi:hypothetical protein
MRVLRLFQKRMAVTEVHLAPQAIHTIVMRVNKAEKRLGRRARHRSIRARPVLEVCVQLLSREFGEVEVDVLVR